MAATTSNNPGISTSLSGNTGVDDGTVGSILNKLLTTLRDGQTGFETAANAVDDSALKAELQQYSQQRQEFSVELKSAMVGLGVEPSDGSSVAAALHKGWINLKSAIASNDRYAVLAECERGEDSAVEQYREALGAKLPSPVAGIVETQYEAVQRVHDRVRALRDAAKQ